MLPSRLSYQLWLVNCRYCSIFFYPSAKKVGEKLLLTPYRVNLGEGFQYSEGSSLRGRQELNLEFPFKVRRLKSVSSLVG